MKRFINVLILLCLPLAAFCCDVCGSAGSGNLMGMLPQNNRNFIGLSYGYQTFTSQHPSDHGGPAAMATDYFQKWTLWGGYGLGKRWQLLAFLPFNHNYSRYDLHTDRMSGLGDAQLSALYTLYQSPDSAPGPWSHRLLAGAGVKMPTGRRNLVNASGLIVSNMQPGTGSWDALANVQYTLGYGNWGLISSGAMRLPTVNDRDYLYGIMLSADLNAFYKLQRGARSWMPQLGARYQWSQTDLSSYAYQIENPYSGGYQLYASAGLGMSLSRISAYAQALLPIRSYYAMGLVEARPRFEAQLQYLF